MSSQRHPSAGRQLFFFATALLLCLGNSHSASSQVPDLASPSRPDTSPNPQSYVRRFANNHSTSRPKRTPSNLPQPAPETRAAADNTPQRIEQAIEDGNLARGKNNYEEALTHYREAEKLNPKEARAFYGMGNIYSDLYCYDSTIEAYLKALDFKKDYLEARVGLGYAYLNKERYDDARKQFQAVLTPAPKNVSANIGLGIVEAKQGKYQEAIQRISIVINDQSIPDKDRAPAHVALGDVYWKQEKWPEVIAQYEAAIKLNPDLGNAYVSLGAAQMSSAFSRFASVGLDEVRMQDRELLAASARQAANNIQKAMLEHNYNHPHAYLFLGFAMMHQAHYQEATGNINTYLDKVGELEKRLPSLTAKCNYGFTRLRADGYWYLGNVGLRESAFETNSQRKTELIDEAIKKFKRVIELKEDYGFAYSSLGFIYSQQGKYEEAIEHYKKAILYTTDESSRAIQYQSIGLTYLKLGRGEAATDNLREAIKLKPNEPSFYEALASIYVGQGNLEDTFKMLRKADEVRTTPSTNPAPYFYLGATYAVRFLKMKNEEDFNEATKWLKKVIEIRPDYATAYYSLGIVYWRHSNANEALANYEKGIRYDEKNPANYLGMGEVYFELKHNDEAAIERFRKAIELKRDYAEAYWRLGLVYHHKKDDAEAIKQMQEAIKYDPKYLRAYEDLAVIYREQKNYPEALKLLTKATEIAPTDFEPYKEMAKFYEAQGRNEDAIRYYEEAINRLSADDSSTKNLYLGRIARLKGRYTEAIEYFRKLNFPDEPGQTYFEIGVMYVSSKNKKAALEQYQQLVQLKSSLAEELLKKINEMK